MRRLARALLLCLASCGSTGLILKQPLVMGCREAHIPPASCPDLADGVIEYVDGDKEAAERKIRAAVAHAEPAQLRQFVKALEALDRLPGSDSFMGPIHEVLAMLDPGAEAASAGAGTGAGAPAGAGASPQQREAEDGAAIRVQKHPKHPELGATRLEAKITCEHQLGVWVDQGSKVGCKVQGANIFACTLAEDSTVTACTHWKLGAEVADERDAIASANGKPTSVSLSDRGFRNYTWVTPTMTLTLTGYGAGVVVTEAKADDSASAAECETGTIRYGGLCVSAVKPSCARGDVPTLGPQGFHCAPRVTGSVDGF